MNSEFITECGQLRDEYRPAIYFETSVLADYWLVEGCEMPETDLDRIVKQNELPHLQVARDLLNSQTRLSKVAEIRKTLVIESSGVKAVISPVCVLELVEWYAGAAFKQIASEAAGAITVQRRSKKEVGDILKKATEIWRAQADEETGKVPTSGIELFMQETTLHPGFASCHGFDGLLLVNVINFRVETSDAFGSAYPLAYMQLGLADIIHLLIARHLRCDYFASFDSDHRRIEGFITSEFAMELLPSPDAILHVLRKKQHL